MTAPAHNVRLDVRLPEEKKALIEQAAGALGQTVSAFAIATLVREAREVVDQFGVLRLTDQDRDAFITALDNPPPPSTKLRRAAKEHAKIVTQ